MSCCMHNKAYSADFKDITFIVSTLCFALFQTHLQRKQPKKKKIILDHTPFRSSSPDPPPPPLELPPQHIHKQTPNLGLSTRCSSFSKKLLLYRKLLEKTKTFLGLMLKTCKLYDKSKISKHFCAILRRNQPC